MTFEEMLGQFKGIAFQYRQSMPIVRDERLAELARQNKLIYVSVTVQLPFFADRSALDDALSPVGRLVNAEFDDMERLQSAGIEVLHSWSDDLERMVVHFRVPFCRKGQC